MKVHIPCGKKNIELKLPASAQLIEPKPQKPLQDPEGSVINALKNPLGAKPLAEIARTRKNACIVVSDITRPVPNRIILPPIIKALNQAGIQNKDITILIATGMHRPNLGDELIELLGPETAGLCRVVNHDCHDHGQMREVDRLEGYPIELNKTFLEADLKILTGLIEPHSFAGYSGGGKSVLPGVASFESMKFMHSFAMIADPALNNGRVKKNPFQKHVRHIAEKAGVDFIVNVIIDKQKNLSQGIFAGELCTAHDAGCRAAASSSLAVVPQAFDLVVSCGGGYPLDTTFYQASKGLMSVSEIVKSGGKMLFLAGCQMGIGSPELIEMFKAHKTPESFYNHFKNPKNFTIDQWGAQRFYQCRERMAEMHIYAPGFKAADYEILGAHQVEDPQQALDKLAKSCNSIAVTPEGPYMVVTTETCLV